MLLEMTDRGPDSAGVIKRARKWRKKREVRILAGNHEEMFLESFHDAEVLRHFLKHGGRETILSYGISRKDYRKLTLEELFARLPQIVPLEDRDFVAGFEDMILAGDYVFVVDDEDVLFCLSWQDGRVRWLTELPRWEDPDDHTDPVAWAGPILAGDRLLLAGSHGEVLAVSPYTGRITGRIDVGEGVDVAPIAADGTVYLLTQSARLIALR